MKFKQLKELIKDEVTYHCYAFRDIPEIAKRNSPLFLALDDMIVKRIEI